MGLVRGVGIHEKGYYSGYSNNRPTKEYVLWQNMLERCYSGEYHLKHPTYQNCNVSENFKNFQYFAGWCNQQIGFGLKGYQLDKDILYKGNKHYSETSCVFVPNWVNILFSDTSTERGLPVGVNTGNGRFVAYIKRLGKSVNLGYYDTKEEAHLRYREAKRVYVEGMALSYKDNLDERVYEAILILSRK